MIPVEIYFEIKLLGKIKFNYYGQAGLKYKFKLIKTALDQGIPGKLVIFVFTR